MAQTARNLMRTLASDQHGVLLKDKLTSIGFGNKQLHIMCEQGELKRVSQSVYQLRGVPWSWEGDLLALCLSQAPNGWVSHRSAARLWGSSGFNDHVIDVIVPRHSRRPRIQSEFRLHESKALPEQDITMLRGIPVTTPARTIIDTAAVASAERLEYLVEDMQRRDFCTFEEIEKTFRRLTCRGRHGMKKLRAILERQSGRERRIDSRSNLRLRNELTKYGLPIPLMEYPISVTGTTYVVDLAYPTRKLAIECVSEAFHLRKATYAKDNTRRNRLLTAGWIVLEFTWHQIYEQPQACIREVANAYDRALQNPQRA